MDRRIFLASVSSAAIGGSVSIGAAATSAKDDDHREGKPAESNRITIVAWNVACGQWCTAEQVADALADRKPDLLLLNETPKFNTGVAAADWSQQIGDRLGLKHVYVGSISSANHAAPDWGDVTGNYGGKFKSILSRWPISNTHDYALDGDGWSPASAVRAEVSINGASYAIYSLHIPGTPQWETSKHHALEDVLKHEPLKNTIVGGDFNVQTDSPLLSNLIESTGLKNVITSRSIDHILYRSKQNIRVVASGIERGPAGKGPRGGLSDHPYAWSVWSIRIGTGLNLGI